MDQVLDKVPNTSTYVDNILTHSTTAAEHLDTLEMIFKRIRRSNLSLRMDKCEFAKNKVEQFGFIVDTECLRPTDAGVTKVNQNPRPACI